MDIIDVLVAKKLTPQGEIDTYAKKSEQAVKNAAKAIEDAQLAIDAVNDASSDVEALQQQAGEALATASEALEKTNEALEKISEVNTNFKLDGAPGAIVILDDEGNLIASTKLTEDNIIKSLANGGIAIISNAVGLEINYEQKQFERLYDAESLTMGYDFNKYSMYGGRKRCMVDNNGKIVAFYEDANYTDSQKSGYQMMVYQPKFYYMRTPLKMDPGVVGSIVRKEMIVISETAQDGFKLHPLFINENNEELEYVLLPAYDGSIESNDENSYTDNTITDFENCKLSSVVDAKPISGLNNNLTVTMAEKLAQNRGPRWHITNMQAESANQMLEMIEFGTMNGQTALESGIGNVPNNSEANCSAITGSTASLGNNTGVATSTTFTIAGTTVTYSEEGRRAISYRGAENPWGNIWHMIGGINIWGNGSVNGGIPYIANDFNYDVNSIANYDSVGFALPSSNNWISAMGYGNKKFDWVFMPAETSSAASSLLPVGDLSWFTANLNGINRVGAGGSWSFGANNGPFYYGCDKQPSEKARSYGARLMLIPHTTDSAYNYNISLWRTAMEGDTLEEDI